MVLPPSPSPSPAASPPSNQNPPPSFPPLKPKLSVDFSPPLIAMVVVIATAFVVITYSRLLSRKLLHLRNRFRLYRRRRHHLNPSSAGDLDSSSPSFNTTTSHHQQTYGLDESTIKSIPLTLFTPKSPANECAVCLIEFQEHDYIRTLPSCYHSFHINCIDVWLRSHASCPLCRTTVFLPNSPFTPAISATIRPNLDELIIETAILETLSDSATTDHCQDTSSISVSVSEITQFEPSSLTTNNVLVTHSEDRYIRRDFLLKRSFSFGYERNLGSERLVMEPATTSPWRYRRGGAGFWSGKRGSSPFSSLISKHRVFSFRYYKGMKSPFFRRKSLYFPITDSGTGGVLSSRRSKSFASPMFMRTSGANTSSSSVLSSSSRLRSGDPEALLSPERFNRRRE